MTHYQNQIILQGTMYNHKKLLDMKADLKLQSS